MAAIILLTASVNTTGCLLSSEHHGLFTMQYDAGTQMSDKLCLLALAQAFLSSMEMWADFSFKLARVKRGGF